MASRLVSDLDIRLQNAWNKAVAEWNNKNGLIPFLTCTFRSPQEQNETYAKGRTAAGKVVTNAKAFQSPHNFTPSQAFDFCFEKNENGKMIAIWNDTKAYAELRQLILNADHSLVSGASFKMVDADHIETNDWRVKFKEQIV